MQLRVSSRTRVLAISLKRVRDFYLAPGLIKFLYANADINRAYLYVLSLSSAYYLNLVAAQYSG